MSMTNDTTTPELTVHVRDLLRTPGARKHVDLRFTPAGLGTPVAMVDEGEQATLVADIDSVVDGLLLNGRIAAWVRLSCVRCLTEVDRTVEVEVTELFALDPADAEEPGYAVVPVDLLPLDTMIRDALVLALPNAPVCRDDCAGLCPRCGADRNTADCGHGDAVADPRWLPLAGLLAPDGEDTQD
jgi:uncharacterized protein